MDQDKERACVLQGDGKCSLQSVRNSSSLMFPARPEIGKWSDCTKGIINYFSLNKVSIMSLTTNAFFSCLQAVIKL